MNRDTTYLTKDQLSRLEDTLRQPWLTGRQRNIKDARRHLVRSKAIVFTLAYVGLRLAELCQLNAKDVELTDQAGTLHLREESAKRHISIPAVARTALQEWISLRKELGFSDKKDAPLFVRLRGNPGQRLTPRSVQTLVSEAGERAGLEKHLSPLVLRNTCAYLLRQAGIRLETRAYILGRSIEAERADEAEMVGSQPPSEEEIGRAAQAVDNLEMA